MATKHHLTHPFRIKFEHWRRATAGTLAVNHGACAQLARDLGLPRQTVWRWFHGNTPMPAWAVMPIRNWLKLKSPPQSGFTPPSASHVTTQTT